MRDELERVFGKSWAWARARDYAGHDPFDALNSHLFQSTPFRHSRLARIIWTQAFKRAPINLRAPALVPREMNAKGTALFTLAALARYRTTASADDEREARSLLDRLLAARLQTAEGFSAWGYNFDWQGRAFFAPKGTPTVVPTAFAVRALVEAHEAFVEEQAAREYLKVARSACAFILGGLKRSAETEEEICFSYTPLDRTRVFNASLLAGESLATVGTLTGERELIETALKSARYVVRRQRADGSWAYGEADFQSWADNFHTAFVLISLARIRRACEAAGDELTESIRRGYRFWRESFFLADGWPKYYHRSAYPADAHAAGASIVALTELREFDTGALEFAARVARWSIENLFDRRGFFYYQKRRLYTVRTPYMRWSQAWMSYALARYLEAVSGQPSAFS